ncbi:hypothetical protein [Chondromyces apiculatus]|uniref:hypothetical protein n=1 Tax=Chondromyces apiculatus TaxID=51 RepID=UPI0005C47D21|nr:hypothetical protein [Chondromyces apiculatus]
MVTHIGLAPPASALAAARNAAAQQGATSPAIHTSEHPQAAGHSPGHPRTDASTPAAPPAAPPSALQVDPLHAPDTTRTSSKRSRGSQPSNSAGLRWDEDVTMQRLSVDFLREQELAAFAREHPELANIRVDDLDEDTRVIEGARTDVAPLVQASAAAEAWSGATNPDGPVRGETLAEAGLTGQPHATTPDADGSSEDDTAAFTHIPDPSWAADPTRWRPPAPPRVPATPLEPLPALRVAVLATGTPGEVRVVLLGERTEPPMGAATAILVPLSASEGGAIARLLSGV